MSFTIDFQPSGIRLLCDGPLAIAEAARRAGAGLRSVCGGKGVCGKCLVRIERGDPLPPSAAERHHLSAEQLAGGWRLACRVMVSANASVYIPPVSALEVQVAQTEGAEVSVAPTGEVRIVPLAVAPPTLADQVADLERVRAALRREQGIGEARAGLATLGALRTALRSSGWRVAIALRGDEIIGAYPGAAPPPLGLAVDVGTTKLACYLVDLQSGQTLAATGVMNPQIAYGEDVMSRLEAALVEPAKATRLQQEVAQAINGAAAELTATLGLMPEHLLDICLVGNTAMHHLLAGLPVQPLAVSPFVAALNSSLSVGAGQLGLRAAPGAQAYLPPPIAGFVGSDHLAFLLAAGFGRSEPVRLGIDIGTNTEIALQTGARIVSCSTASGPAFEGAHIRHGMRAAPGAIERVAIAGGEVRCDVIGGGSAAGICGSGVIAALAEMRSAGIINARGRMVAGMPGVMREDDDMPAFTLAPGGEGRRAVCITQHDIDQVLLAKGAIRAGIDILMDHLGVEPARIEEVVIAGAFGSYLDPRHAMGIGLLPSVPLERVWAAGNAASAGARMMLASSACRREAEALAGRIEYLEVTVVPGFNRYFSQGARLPAGS
ncbi:MAG TPA: ASKHA domain-containing protein [Anaerolineae bacterium]|nr:ASKHA domain-containing protein [Anaerolineae bacterium]HOQ97578.1 ASKHA domain-containing protein [Anaerolineae bacterium]HPL28397.1 ASKHA domain-containing protein [Anaerolineae bacterium]